jgi:hypothetical protein
MGSNLGMTHLSHDATQIVRDFLQTPGLMVQTRAGKWKCRISDAEVAERLNLMYAGTKTFERPLTHGQVGRVRKDLFGPSRDKVAPKPPEPEKPAPKLIKLADYEPAAEVTPAPQPPQWEPQEPGVWDQLEQMSYDLGQLRREFADHRVIVNEIHKKLHGGVTTKLDQVAAALNKLLLLAGGWAAPAETDTPPKV